MKTAHLNVIKGLNLKYLFIKFDSKILQAPQIPIWETFVSKNLPDNCIRTFSLSKYSRALRTTGWFLIRKRLLDLRTHRIIFDIRCYEKRWTASKISFFFMSRFCGEINYISGQHPKNSTFIFSSRGMSSIIAINNIY